MFCPKCGNRVEQNINFCPNCGNCLNITEQNNVSTKSVFIQQNESTPNYVNQQVSNDYNQTIFYAKKRNNIGITCVIIGILLLISITSLIFVLSGGSNDYYFPSDNDEQSDTGIVRNNNTVGKYKTVIVTDNYYEGVNIRSVSDAKELIVKDSTDQKSNCPSNIKRIEDKIIMNYGITAVNLCEMDISFAEELVKVLGKVYNEFPSIRGYLTNLTLNNVSLSQHYIAAFMPIFTFANMDMTLYPMVVKTQILLNTSYYLNKDRFKASVDASTKMGHFPKNTTIYSPVAHELGHYISFLAMMKYHRMDSLLLINNQNYNLLYDVYNDFQNGSFSLSMIKEAYDNYVRDKGSRPNFDEWRGTISKYALAKDNSGKYIYDETIAESFHDVYLNGNNAADASQYIINVLKKKLGS